MDRSTEVELRPSWRALAVWHPSLGVWDDGHDRLDGTRSCYWLTSLDANGRRAKFCYDRRSYRRVSIIMPCLGCGSVISPESPNCPQCGQRQVWSCGACGMSCEPDFAFCPRCGRARRAPGSDNRLELGACREPERSPAGSLEADRRQVTVLFADVSGYTALSEGLDPEDVRSFLNVLFQDLVDIILRYDGYVDKFIGDEVMAVFGAPIAHENDPERALCAALDMVAACAKLSGEWQARLGRPVDLHISVHTGPVVAGSVGDAARAAYTVTGDTVNTAARLLSEASGAILVSESTHALSHHLFAFTDPRSLALRGKARPITAYRLFGRLAEPHSARGLSRDGITSTLIGRGNDLAQLRQSFRRMQMARAQLVNLIGEAGTGKTRLVSEFLASLQAAGDLSGVAVRRISCSSLGEPAYGTFGQLFREGYNVQRDDSLEDARQKLAQALRSQGADAEIADVIIPVLDHMLGLAHGEPSGVEPEQLRRQILLAARALVAHRLSHGPLLIIVDDYHWADAASGDILSDLVDGLVDQPLMLILAHRPDIGALPITRVAQTVIRLAPLTIDEARTFVGNMFGDVPGEAFETVRDVVATRSGGNPLFIEEMVRNLVSASVLVRSSWGWSCSSAKVTGSVPPTLHGLLLSRVDCLPPPTRRLLQEAAVLGLEFDPSLLADIASEPEDIERSLAELSDLDLIRKTADPHHGSCYRFIHALVHEVVYQNLLLAQRTRLHGKAGHALESLVGTQPERLSDLEALAHHWSLSADKLRGGRYLLVAGDRARALYANEDAMRYFDRALHALAECEGAGPEVMAARESLADLLALTGQRAEAFSHYEFASRSALASSDDIAASRLYRKLGELHWESGERTRAEECFALGLARLDAKGATIERARLFHEIGRLAFQSGDNQKAIVWAQRALAEAESSDGSDAPGNASREAALTRAHAYNTLGIAMARLGRLDEAVNDIRQSTQLAEENDLLQAACRGYANLGVLYSTLNPHLSIETCLQGLTAAKKIGDLSLQSKIYANLAVSYCALTDHCDIQGIEAARKAIDLDRRLGLLDHLAIPLIVLGQIHQCRGEGKSAQACYQEALSLAERSGDPQLLFPCYDGLATLYLDAGNQPSAELYLQKSQDICARAGLEPDALMVLPFLN